MGVSAAGSSSLCTRHFCLDTPEGPENILGSDGKRCDSVLEDGRHTPEWCCWEQVGVDLMLEASQEHLLAKSAALCELFITLVEQECGR